MFNGGSLYRPIIHEIFTGFVWRTFFISAIDVALWLYYTLGSLIYLGGTRWPPSIIFGALGSRKSTLNIKNREDHVTSHYSKKQSSEFWWQSKNYSQGARAASVLSTHSCFTPFEEWHQASNGLDGLKGLLKVCPSHINNDNGPASLLSGNPGVSM